LPKSNFREWEEWTENCGEVTTRPFKVWPCVVLKVGTGTVSASTLGCEPVTPWSGTCNAKAASDINHHCVLLPLPCRCSKNSPTCRPSGRLYWSAELTEYCRPSGSSQPFCVFLGTWSGDSITVAGLPCCRRPSTSFRTFSSEDVLRPRAFKFVWRLLRSVPAVACDGRSFLPHNRLRQPPRGLKS